MTRARGVAGACLVALLAVGVVRGAPVAAAESPVVSLGDASGLERDSVTGSVFVPVFLSEPAAVPVTVSFASADGTAVAGADFARWGTTANPRTVTIPAGSLQTTINVPVLADTDAEDDEQFSVTVTSVAGGDAVVGDGTGVATIVDAEELSVVNPALTVSSGSVVEGDAGQRRAQFHVHLSRPPTTNVTITYRTVDGSATAGVDYTAKLPGTVVFAPGQISKTIDVLVVPNTSVDGTRTFGLAVAVAGGSPVEEMQTDGVATIVDDDAAAVDDVPPELTLPDDLVAAATAPDGAAVSWSAAATDGVDGTVPVDCSPASGARFAVGETAVECSATDAAGNTATGGFTVTVAPFTPAAQTIAAGGRHTCVIVAGGAVECWGDNADGQLGNGTFIASKEPVPVSGLTGAIAISSRADHTCAVLADHTARCWGRDLDSFNVLGAGSAVGANSAVPVAVTVLAGLEVVDIQPGSGFTCALIADGTVRCWGQNSYGELGRTAPSPSGVGLVTGITDAVALSSGNFHSCAVLASGGVRCWGNSANGRRGGGSAQVDVPGITNAVDVAAGGYNSCVLLSDATAQCWGTNAQGQLGAGVGGTESAVPVAVAGLANLAEVTAGSQSNCARGEHGAVWCWGWNILGAVGDGTTTDSNLPVGVSGMGAGARTVVAGNGHVCAQLDVGDTTCWGSNSSGQLGNGGPTDPSPTPSPVDGLTDPTSSLSVGGKHTCVVSDAGVPRCWGDNTYGQLGDATTTSTHLPVQVSGLPTVLRVAAGATHTCAVLTDATAACWGRNESGQLGNGTTTDSTVPVPVTGLTDVTRIAVLGSHSCATSGDGSVRCWGVNTYGQLGDGSTTDSTVPVLVTGVSDAVDVVVGNDFVGASFPQTGITVYSHSCALLAGGGVTCWGRNNAGQLGGTGGGATKVDVAGISTATSIAAGSKSTCVVLADGTARCWGSNVNGQLGNGSTVSSAAPVVVTGLSGAVGLSMSALHTCAVLDDGTARCWGDNRFGQLGDGNFSPSGTSPIRSTVPVTVAGLAGAVAISASAEMSPLGSLGVGSCALSVDGSLHCWGDNTEGRLGIGLPYSTVPSPVTGLA